MRDIVDDFFVVVVTEHLTVAGNNSALYIGGIVIWKRCPMLKKNVLAPMVNLSSFNCSTDRWRQLSRQSYAKSSRANRIQPSRKVRSRGQAALSPPNAPTASHRLVLKWNFTYFSSLTRPHTHIGIYLANRRQMGICQWHGDCPWPHWHVIGQNYEFAFEFACEQSIDGSEAEGREGKGGVTLVGWVREYSIFSYS